MTLLATLVLGAQAATAADFFPLTPGTRRIYEEKGVAKAVVIDEVGTKPIDFGSGLAYPVYRKSKFNQILDTTYYRVDGPTVLIVGYAEDRRAATPIVGQPVDLTKGDRKNVLMTLIPAMPVFKYDGGPTTWTYAEVPKIQGPSGEEPVVRDETAIAGSVKPGPLREVLGRKVETIVVRADIEIGLGKLQKKQMETSVYGRGIGLIETTIKTTFENRSSETKTTLIGIEEKREGG
ncbi:hypothetical protein EON82_00025 [bacterium]|nr:MAG: hypothetical protein EON82_00025 [bacterium]